MFNTQIINARLLAKKGANFVSTAQILNAPRETLDAIVKLADRAQELYAIVKDSEGGEIPANIKSFIRNADTLRKDYNARAIDPAYSRQERAAFEKLGNDLSIVVRLAAQVK
ncbi:hypothetical protein Ares1_0098 [Vibrio phage Ares1]|nr:hypothetical protein Ares1_0098 [Vibrio phage Ares1]